MFHGRALRAQINDDDRICQVSNLLGAVARDPLVPKSVIDINTKVTLDMIIL